MGDRQQRSLWLDIPRGRVHPFDRAAGSDDAFGPGKPAGVVGLHTGKIKVSGRLSGKWSSSGLVRAGSRSGGSPQPSPRRAGS
jgi:hypothetical protein